LQATFYFHLLHHTYDYNNAVGLENQEALMLPVSIYARRSTDKQDNSVESQMTVLTGYAHSHDMAVVKKYLDEGISGRFAGKRPAFMQMIEDSAGGGFKAVLVYDSSRFARNLEESIVYKSALKRNGVELISITEPNLGDDDSALITDAMLGAINEMFSRKLSKAVKRGMVYAAQRGKFQTNPPYGYSRRSGTVEVIPDEAEIVKLVFDRCLNGKSAMSTARYLNDNGVRKRTAFAWQTRDITRMLKNAAYIGYVNYSGECYKGLHEPIIDADTWKKVKAIMDAKPQRRSRPGSTYKHWLSGIMVCYHCGGTLYHVQPKDEKPYYRCSGNIKGTCSHTSMHVVSKFEQIVRAALETHLPDDGTIMFERIAQREINEKAFLEKTLTGIVKRLERYKAAYAAGVDSIDEYRANKEACLCDELELRKRLQTILAEEQTLEKKAGSKVSASQLIDMFFYDEFTVEEKSAAIKKIIQKIVVHKEVNEYTVHYCV
jgi:DNA invertase Pin-like site-specific DNA recombinase